MKKLGIMFLAVLFALPFSVFALTSGENYTQSLITYDVGNASYEWSIPQSFALEETSATYGWQKVYRADIPITFSNVQLPGSLNSTDAFAVTVTSANNFNLVKPNTDSSIPYVLPQDKVYFTKAGTETVPACTLTSNILQATDFGVHSDVLTFTVSYVPGELGAMSFNAPDYCPLSD